MLSPDPQTRARLEALMKEHGLTTETVLYRETLPEFLSPTKKPGIFRISANPDPIETVVNVYDDGHTWGAHQIGAGLAFTPTQGNEWRTDDRRTVCVTIQALLEEGGLLYPVESVITDRAWYVTLPSGGVEVRQF